MARQFDRAAARDLRNPAWTLNGACCAICASVSPVAITRVVSAERHPARRGLWRYRVGDYRIVAAIEDDRFVVLVVAVGHRREVYR